MQYLLLLSRQDINLAKEEAVALLKPKKAVLDENLFILDASPKRINLAKRLAYTKAVYQLLFSSNNIERDIHLFSWQRIYNTDFSLRFWHHHEKEAELAGHIWAKLGKAKVNLTNAKTRIELFKTNKTYCCLLLFAQKEDFEGRKAHLRPGFMPVSLHPKLARCLVNLTGVERGLVLDPFCGTGGILIEAGLIGLKTKGYDTDEKMIDRCRQNLEHFSIKKYRLVQRNALNLEKAGYIATDLPYGISTKRQDFKKLYQAFFRILEKQLGKRAVIAVPSHLGTRPLTRKLRLVKEFLYYIHKNLTKKILIIEQK